MENRRVDLAFVGMKAKSKLELYRLLTVDVMLYLPPQEYTNMNFISDICFNEKKALLAKDVMVCSVLHVDSLRTKDLIDFLIEECNGNEYLPSDYIHRTPRMEWIVNICNTYRMLKGLGNTLQHDRFQEKIKDVLSERQESLLKIRNLAININPHIAIIFQTLKWLQVFFKFIIIVPAGRGKKNILRKEREEKEAAEEEKKKELDSIVALKEQIKRLNVELITIEIVIEDFEKDQAILRDLYEHGIIDENGKVL